ncbi:hypothetical protein Cni_G22411 [Canna indica]|uniref:Uncharacterized protein n=1 Tax=Canna indica TaxID=4628 RepID=A0AAQ3KRC0_9LILI|nr:hypothetical protein Cni_G22411 [Canna indica]
MVKQKMVMKLCLEDARKRSKALKAAVGLPGVISVALDKDRIIVVGDGVDSVALTTIMRKKFGYVELVSVSSAEEKKEEKKSVSSSNQKMVMKLCLEDARKRSKALKAAVGLPGRIIVVGVGVVSVALTTLLRKKFGYVELVSVGSAEEKKEEKKSVSSSNAGMSGIQELATGELAVSTSNGDAIREQVVQDHINFFNLLARKYNFHSMCKFLQKSESNLLRPPSYNRLSVIFVMDELTRQVQQLQQQLN